MTLTPDQQKLYDFMSDISEASYCAGWMENTEYRLWTFMTNTSDDGDWGQFPIPGEARDRLNELCRSTGGWTFFKYDGDRPGESGPVFVSLAAWTAMYADRTIGIRHEP
ncbi:MAG: hypothetical protein ABIP44_09350 [Pseudoxanthomonas sp.]